MPCNDWKELAYQEKSHRQQYSYFAFNQRMAGVSDHKRKQLMKEHMEAMTEASNDMHAHQNNCEICRNEPPENFIDPDPWSKGTQN